MQAVIPAAGRGTRLYPQTHTKPKAMVRLAGRPILGHILANLAETRIEEVVIVVGSTDNQITEYATAAFGDTFDFTFVEQLNPEGLGHSVYQAHEAVGDEPTLIALGDMLFETGYARFLDAYEALDGVGAAIGVKPVDEPQHYGVVETDDRGRIVSLVEKPEDPPSDLAISGAYVVEESEGLFRELGRMIETDERGAGGEFQLTDALAGLLDRGVPMGTFRVEDWYDCGRPETLLEANRVLLSKLGGSGDGGENVVFVPPVDVGSDVTVESSVVGPNVSIDDGATVEHSVVTDTIVGRDATLNGVNLSNSIVGDTATVEGEPNELNVGDNSTISL